VWVAPLGVDAGKRPSAAGKRNPLVLVGSGWVRGVISKSRDKFGDGEGGFFISRSGVVGRYLARFGALWVLGPVDAAPQQIRPRSLEWRIDEEAFAMKVKQIFSV